MANYSIGAMAPEDAQFLPQFLALAAHEANAELALQNPDLARYASDWGRPGDCGVAARSDGGALIGLAWARLWRGENRGFGFVDELTPEMAVAVREDFRGQGIGAALIDALKCRLRALQLEARWDTEHQKWVPLEHKVEVPQPDMEISPAQVSLSVRADSPASLYRRCGFEPLENSETGNRAGGKSQIWRASLNEGGDWRAGAMDRSINVNWAGAPDDFVNVNFYYNLRFDLFDASDWTRFYELMASLPEGEPDEDFFERDSAGKRNSWMFFGDPPVKAAVHWSHLWVEIEGDLRVGGDLKWEEWCAWDEAFSWRARGLPHALKQDESPELRELRAALKMTEEALGRDREQNRKMRLRLRHLGESAFG